MIARLKANGDPNYFIAIHGKIIPGILPKQGVVAITL